MLAPDLTSMGPPTVRCGLQPRIRYRRSQPDLLAFGWRGSRSTLGLPMCGTIGSAPSVTPQV